METDTIKEGPGNSSRSLLHDSLYFHLERYYNFKKETKDASGIQEVCEGCAEEREE